jgi:hypothetical protein
MPNQISALDALRKVLLVKAVVTADHEGFRHDETDWWQFEAFETSPKTCDLCKALDLQMFRGDRVPDIFPYHTHRYINVIRAKVHQNCRCRLIWAGRTEKSYNTPLGILLPEESRAIRLPEDEALEQLDPSQLQQLLAMLESPWE